MEKETDKEFEKDARHFAAEAKSRDISPSTPTLAKVYGQGIEMGMELEREKKVGSA